MLVATLLTVLLSLSTVSAHNWVNSPSRVGTGAQASTVAPTVPSKTGQPHVQVIAGQKFAIEWVIGHPSTDTTKFFHFVVLAKKDADKMKLHDPRALDEYLQECKGAENAAPSAEWANYHYKYGDTTLDNDPNNNSDGEPVPREPNFFAERVMPNNNRYIARDKNFEGRFKGAPRNGVAPAKNGFDYSKVHQFRYKDAVLTKNRRCTHTSAKFPWILAVHRYRGVMHQPSRPDVAWFEIPAGNPPGDYIVHYRWRGYYDAVDVQVVPGTTAVPAPYGGELPPNPPVRFRRLDHCNYPRNTIAGQCRAMTGEPGKPLPVPQACLNECKGKSIEQCEGVIVVPIEHPDTVFAGFRSGANAVDVNIPTSGNNCANARKEAGATHVCYPLLGNTELKESDVEAEFILTTDSEDPGFYSTCYHRAPPSAFAVEDLPPEPSHWEFRGRCVSCELAAENSRADVTPTWVMEDNCVNCGLFVASNSDPRLRALVTFDGDKVGNAAQAGGVEAKAVGSVAFGAGVVGRALKLDGDAANYVDLGAMNVGGKEFTMAAFAKFASFANDPRVLSKAAGAASADHTWMLSSDCVPDDGDCFPRVRLRVGADNVVQLIGDDKLTANKWHHIAATYDGAVLKLFLDGKITKSMNAAGAVQTNAQAANIGRNPVGGRPFTGMIDDVRIYAATLTDSEIAGMAAQLSGRK